MRALIFAAIFAFLPFLAHSQCYPNLKARGQTFYAQQQYDEAIRHYLGALNCPDRPSPQQDAVPDLIKAALQARVDQLNAALDQVEAERQKTEEALAQANKLIDAFYFYADRFALAFKDNRFYYIDKNGDPVEKLGKWESAEQFDNRLGLARVKRYDQLMLLDTFGNSYPLVTEVEQLTEGLTALDLSDQGIDSIPEVVFGFPSLEILLLTKNQLSELPAAISRLENLRYLSLSANQIKELPAEIGRLNNLVRLDLSLNQLWSLPESMGQLTNLQHLDLDWTYLRSLPPEFAQLAQLKTLSLQNTKLSTLPAWIGQLTQLTNLQLWGSELTVLPAEIGQLKNLSILDLGSNPLKSFPAAIRQLSSLIELDLSNTRLLELPAALGQLTQLQSLDLRTNSLTLLPPEIRGLTALKSLDLGKNRLTELPPEIGQLSKLEKLYLSSNRLTHVPEEMAQLNQLNDLSLSDNQLLSFPPEIMQMDKLEKLHITKNRFAGLPEEVLSRQEEGSLLIDDYTPRPLGPLGDEASPAEVKAVMAMLYYQVDQDYRGAFVTQRAAVQMDPENTKLLYDLSNYALLAGEYQAAILAAQQVLARQPNEIRAAALLSVGYMLNDEWTAAESLFQKWKEHSAQDSEDHSYRNRLSAVEELITGLRARHISHPDFDKVWQLLAKDDE